MIPKHIVTNEAMQPVAIQINYADWLKIERLLSTYDQTDTETAPELTGPNKLYRIKPVSLGTMFLPNFDNIAEILATIEGDGFK